MMGTSVLNISNETKFLGLTLASNIVQTALESFSKKAKLQSAHDENNQTVFG